MIWGGRVVDADGKTNPRSCALRPSLWSVIAQAAGLSAIWPDVLEMLAQHQQGKMR
jgi:hypothetical protein